MVWFASGQLDCASVVIRRVYVQKKFAVTIESGDFGRSDMGYADNLFQC